MTEYIRDDGAPDAAAVEQRVVDAIGRDVEGVVVDEDGIQRVRLPEGEELTDGQVQSLESEFNRGFAKRGWGRGAGGGPGSGAGGGPNVVEGPGPEEVDAVDDAAEDAATVPEEQIATEEPPDPTESAEDGDSAADNDGDGATTEDGS